MLREKLVWWDWIIYYLIIKVEIILEAKSQRKYYMTFPPWQKENQVFLDDLEKNPCRINILSGEGGYKKIALCILVSSIFCIRILFLKYYMLYLHCFIKTDAYYYLLPHWSSPYLISYVIEQMTYFKSSNFYFITQCPQIYKLKKLI